MFKLEFSTSNAAFHDVGDEGGHGEISRILHEIADAVQTQDSGKIRDLNGNAVGTWSYEQD